MRLTEISETMPSTEAVGRRIVFLPQPEVQISIKCHTYTRINDCSHTCTCTHTLTNVMFYYSHSL